MKKKQSRRDATRSIEALKHQLQKNDLLTGRQVAFTETEGHKLSDVLLKFIAPYKKDAPTDEAYRKLIAIAVVSWNAAILTGATRQEFIDVAVTRLYPFAGQTRKIGYDQDTGKQNVFALS